jgi:hypothetical protein
MLLVDTVLTLLALFLKSSVHGIMRGYAKKGVATDITSELWA